jgi:hypothetical protein
VGRAGRLRGAEWREREGEGEEAQEARQELFHGVVSVV